MIGIEKLLEIFAEILCMLKLRNDMLKQIDNLIKEMTKKNNE